MSLLCFESERKHSWSQALPYNHDFVSKKCMCARWGIEDCGVMSDLCMYELEDNVWDEFNETDDHIVPHTGHGYEDQFGVQSNGHKKLRPEVIGFASNADDVTKHSTQSKEEISLPNPKRKNIMLEKGPWSHASDALLHASCNSSSSIKEVTSTASDKTRMSNNNNIDSVGSKLCADDPILDEKCAAIDDNSFRYQLSNISQSENDLSFLDNECEEKERTDLLYYEWPPDIGNFEDVDRMFRSCDSTFGLGSNEDDMCWFSSSHSAEGSEDAEKLSSKFSNSEASGLNSVSEYNEASRINSAGHLLNDSNKKNLACGDKINSGTAGAVDDSALDHLSYLNGSDTKPTNLHKKQARLQNQSDGKRNDVKFGNGNAFHHNGSLKQFANMTHSFGDSCGQVFTLSGVQHDQNVGFNSVNYRHPHVPYMQMDYSSLDQISVCPTPSGCKSENNGQPSPSPKESSYASNLVHSMENSHGPKFEAPALITNEKREEPYHHQDLQPSFARNFKHASMATSTFYDRVQKQASQSDYEIEGNSEIEEVSIGIPAELDLSTGQESSCMSSVLDGISLEATGFCQLQQVMEQLDIRTKLCIRDSLYRLARSAEQRHNCVNTNGGKRDDRDTNGVLIAEETNKSTGFMDMETNTNPIDRSVAHLLFHRPSDTSVVPPNGASLMSHAMMHGSISSPTAVAKEHICQEETVTGADIKSASEVKK